MATRPSTDTIRTYSVSLASSLTARREVEACRSPPARVYLIRLPSEYWTLGSWFRCSRTGFSIGEVDTRAKRGKPKPPTHHPAMLKILVINEMHIDVEQHAPDMVTLINKLLSNAYLTANVIGLT